MNEPRHASVLKVVGQFAFSLVDYPHKFVKLPDVIAPPAAIGGVTRKV